MKSTTRRVGHGVVRAIFVGLISTSSLVASMASYADDTPSPCAALKHIVSAAPQGFETLGPNDGRAVAQPYGSDASCIGTHDSYECQWSSNPGAGSVADALQAVAADIASCLPNATHDQNTPGFQHFYIGAKGARTQISATTASGTRLKIIVSDK